jgi:hypothetical protein
MRAGPMSQSMSKGALDMPLLLLVAALVLLAILAPRRCRLPRRGRLVTADAPHLTARPR